MTNNLHKRVFQHKTHCFEGFTDQYNAVRLVYSGRFDDVHKAIGREKQLKAWRREKETVADCAIQSGMEGLSCRVVRVSRNAGSLDLRLVASLLRTVLGMTGNVECDSRRGARDDIEI